MGDGLVTCPKCGQRTAADTGECSWCDRPLGTEDSASTSRPEPKRESGLFGCLGISALVALAAVLSVAAWFGIVCEGESCGDLLCTPICRLDDVSERLWLAVALMVIWLPGLVYMFLWSWRD